MKYGRRILTYNETSSASRYFRNYRRKGVKNIFPEAFHLIVVFRRLIFQQKDTAFFNCLIEEFESQIKRLLRRPITLLADLPELSG